MSAISLKSITGITSITTPAGVDNQLTLHTNNTVERLRITSDGNVGVNTSSVSIAGMSRYLSVSARNVTNGGAAVELVGARTGSDQTLGVINFVNQTSKVAEIRSKYQGSTTLGSLHFQTSGTERLQITSSGDLSLTTTTQNAFLGLKANSNAINFTLGSTTGTYPRAYFYGTGNGQSTAGDIFMGTGVGGDLRLRSGGAIKLQTNSDSSTIDAFYVHAAGTVAVNTFSPDTTYKLDVVGAGQFTTSSTNQQNDFLTGQLTVRNNQNAQGAFIDFRAKTNTGIQGVIAKIGGFNTYSGSGYNGLLTFSTRQNSNNTMVERMRIKSDGYVGISTNNPVNKLHVEGLNTVARFSSSSSYVDIKLQNSNNQLGFIQYNGTELRFFANSGSTPTVYIPNGKFGVNTVPSTTLHVKDAIPEIRLTSTDASLGQSEIVGKLSISTSDPTTPTGAGVVSYIETFSATSNGSDYTTSISNRAGAGGGETRIRLGNALGELRFYTNTSGSGVERLRIDQNGSVSVGDVATHGYAAHSEGDDLVVGGSGWRGLTIYGEGGGGVIQFADNADNRVGQILYNHGDNSMDFRTNGNVTRFEITSGGHLVTGGATPPNQASSDGSVFLKNDATSGDAHILWGSGDGINLSMAGAGTANNAVSFSRAFQVATNRTFHFGSQTSQGKYNDGVQGCSWYNDKNSWQQGQSGAIGWSMMYFNKIGGTSNDNRIMQFASSGSVIGYINRSGSNTQFATSSDYRLKKDVVALPNGIERVKQLRPVAFKWISDNSDMEGFLAHEAQEICPYAVSGTKDEVALEDHGDRKKGDMIVQSVDYGEFTPLLTAAMKELIAKVETLEAEVAALKGS